MPNGERTWEPGTGRGVSPARIVVGEWDRGWPEVMYHDPAQEMREGSRERPFVGAVYHGRGERRSGSVYPAKPDGQEELVEFGVAYGGRQSSNLL